MTRQSALIVDDEPDIRELVTLTLERMSIDTFSAADLSEARRVLAERVINVCLTDMRLPDGDGVDFVRYIQQHYPETPIAVITAYGSMESAVAALKAGAFDFVSKPVDLGVLRRLVQSALQLSTDLGQRRPSPGLALVGHSPAMENLRATIAKLARSQAPVYVSGESGTGKELVARMIHEQGPRGEKPFVAVNCGAIPGELMESEFFGHKRGSFTGAMADKLGLFQAANGGTLFLDEVAELPLHMQVKLLRAIQEKAVRPVGSQSEASVDVRILSATHKDLAELVHAGSFRQDLYYRINVIEVHTPSLRERPDDIPLLAKHILDRLARHVEAHPVVLSDDSMGALSGYGFPGNVRELENILERAMTLCAGSEIQPSDLRLPASEHARQAVPGHMSLETYLDNLEKQALLNALEKTRFNKTAAARVLGISFRQLRYRLKKLGLD